MRAGAVEHRKTGACGVTNNELMILLRGALLDGLAARGKSYAVEQNYQPTQQGTNRDPTVYFHHVNDVMRGWSRDEEIVNPDTGQMQTVQVQLIETRIQIAATVDADPFDPEAVTVIDVLRMARQCIQSREFLFKVGKSGVGVYRVSDLQSVDVLSDSPGYEKRPTFDIIVQHSDVTTVKTDSFDHVDNAPKRGIYRT